MRSKPSTRALISGLTLVEVLVTLAVSLVVIGAAFAVALSSRQLYQTDRLRTDLNQNLRSGMELLGADIRIAGERLGARSGSALTAIEVRGGSELVLRRNLLDAFLPVCERPRIVGGSSQNVIRVARRDNWPFLNENPQCRIIDTDGDGWPDNLQAWRQYRQENGGEVLAYIYTPAGGGRGEFFVYRSEDNSQFQIHRAPGAWQHDYWLTEAPRLYLLEERRYRLRDGVLEVVVNGDEAGALRLIGHVSDFRVRAVMRDGSVREDLGAGDDWAQVAAVEVSLTGSAARPGGTAERTLTSRFFPRNALSN